MKSRKGISPLIATVLLIGFTIVLAALVMRWGSALFEQNIKETDCTSQARVTCASKVDVELGPVSDDTGSVVIPVTSNGDAPIKAFNVRVKNTATGTVTNVKCGEAAGDSLCGLAAANYPLVGWSTLILTRAYINGDTATATNTVEVIPVIDQTGQDGSTCEEVCLDKAKSAAIA